MEKYGDGCNFEDAYIVYIPDDMMPPKSPLSKRMSNKEILRYIREQNSMREDIFNDITFHHDIYEHDTLYEIIDEKLTTIIKKAIHENTESTLSQENFNPFADVSLEELSNVIYGEFKEKINES